MKKSDDLKQQQAIEKTEKVYKEIAEDDKRLARKFLSICSGLSPTSSEKKGEHRRVELVKK